VGLLLALVISFDLLQVASAAIVAVTAPHIVEHVSSG